LAQVAGRDQTSPQLYHICVAHADAQFLVRRHAAPAAARHEILVDENGLLHRRHRLRRQDRRGGRDRARNLRLRVKALRPLALLDPGQKILGGGHARHEEDGGGRQYADFPDWVHRSAVPLVWADGPMQLAV
jgi:hypothetical protein